MDRDFCNTSKLTVVMGINGIPFNEMFVKSPDAFDGLLQF